ncbi:MAG: hypothetical protein U0800_22135 [Isosphaeraceae bacterium]
MTGPAHSSDRKPWKGPLKLALKLALGLLIAGMVARHVAKVWDELGKSGHRLAFDLPWLGTSMLLYAMGLGVFGIAFWRILGRGATPVGPWPALRAYVISHLGKYVPGKALVVVLRAGLVAPYGARPATAAFSTLYETLLMMASGGLIAAMIFGLAGGGPVLELPVPGRGGGRLGFPLAILGLLMGGPLFILALPQVFPKASAIFRAPFPGVGPDSLPRFSGRLLAECLALSVVGWFFWGMSQVAAVRGIGVGNSAAPLGPSDWPTVVASVALATLAGFVVAVFPGGLVVREGVLMAALGPLLGEGEAVVAALGLRLTWVAAELLASGIAVLARPALPPAEACPA